MFSFTRTTITLAFVATLVVPQMAIAQDMDADASLAADATLGQVMMGIEEQASESANADIAAATGWHVCDVVRTGAGWGNHYVALTCVSGPFTNKWHIMRANQKDAMLATALSAAVSNNKVQVNIGSVSSGYNEIRALYLHK